MTAKFDKGRKVEVLKKDEVPLGSWFCGEIISGNGHFYNVKYDHSPPNMSGEIMERVPAKGIRPCPPPLKFPRGLICGDVVEIFQNGSWKVAEVSQVGDNHVQVKLLQSSNSFKVHHSHLRMRQIWKTDKWVTIKKDLRNVGGKRPAKAQADQPNYQTPGFFDNLHDSFCIGQAVTGKNMGPITPHKISRKRKSEGLSLPLEANNTRKKKVYGETSKKLQSSLHLPEMVDSVTVRHTLVRGNRAFPENRVGSFEIKMQRENADAGCLLARNSETFNSDNDTSSVCSCSGSNNPDADTLSYFDLSTYSEGAHSSSESESDRKQTAGQDVDVVAEIHKMELHAYRSTLEALHASGPLTWEQETLVTNLRLMLHISNDEHLLEVRHLISGESNLLG